jgi:pSer/pThr/pTyr-binding forkhead associated (FHA) protein
MGIPAVEHTPIASAVAQKQDVPEPAQEEQPAWKMAPTVTDIPIVVAPMEEVPQPPSEEHPAWKMAPTVTDHQPDADAPTVIEEMQQFIGFEVTGWKGDQRDVDIKGKEITIGRSGSCDLAIKDDPSVSREQAKLIFRDWSVYLMDMGPTTGTSVNEEEPWKYFHGTTVNGKKIPPHAEFRIQPTDVIGVGSTEIRISRINGIDTGPQTHQRAMILPNMTNSPSGGAFVDRQCVALDTKVGSTSARVGSSGDCNLVLIGPGVAPVHATIEFDRSRNLVLKLEAGQEATIGDQRIDSSRRLQNSDVIKIGKNDISIAIGSEESPPCSSEDIYFRNTEHQMRHETFFSELRIMEHAISILPPEIAKRALPVWAKVMIDELSRLGDDDLDCGYERLMASMNYLVGRACCHSENAVRGGGDPLAFFRFIDDNPKRVQFGLLAKRFAGRRSQRLKNVEIKNDNVLFKKIQQSLPRGISPDWGFNAALKTIRDRMEQEEYDELDKGLQSGYYATKEKAIAKLNAYLNPSGIFLWEHGKEIALCQVVSIIYSDLGQSVMVRPLQGFPDIFKRSDGLMTSGFFSMASGMIVLAEESDKKHRLLTHEHEIQHLIDELSGYMTYLSRTYSHDSKQRRRMREATAIAAEYVYSDQDDSMISKGLKKTRRIRSEHGGAAALLLKHAENGGERDGLWAAISRWKGPGPMKELLRVYLDQEYMDAFGITYTDLFYGPDRSPQEICGGLQKVFTAARTQIHH